MSYFISVACDVISDVFQIPLFKESSEWHQVNDDTVLPEKGFFYNWYLINAITLERIGKFTIVINGRKLYCSNGELFESESGETVPQPLVLQYGYASFSYTEQDGKTEYRSQLYQCVCKRDSDSANLREMVSWMTNIARPLYDLLRWPNGPGNATERIYNRCFSLLAGTFVKTELQNSHERVAEILHTYHKNEAYFLTNAEHKLKKVPHSVPIHRAKTVTRDGLEWSVRNGMVRETPECYTGTKIVVGPKSLLPTHTLSDRILWDNNTYENRTIVSFLDVVLQAAKQEHAASLLGHYGEYHTPDLVLFCGSDESGYAKTVDPAEVENLQRNYKKNMGIDEKLYAPVRSLPYQTKVFQEIPVYREFYAMFADWFSGGYSFRAGGEEQVKTNLADSLYENFCWVCLIELFQKNGFSKYAASKRHDYETAGYSVPRFSNIVALKKESAIVTLFFQPVIRGTHRTQRNKNAESGFSLYKRSVSQNNREKFCDDRWTPDFLIKIESPYGIRYGIVDSKFKDMDSLFREHGGAVSTMEDMLIKYYLGMTDDLNRFPISFLWLLQGRAENESAHSLKRDGHDESFSFYPASFYQDLSFGAISLNSFSKEDAQNIIWKELATAFHFDGL